MKILENGPTRTTFLIKKALVFQSPDYQTLSVGVSLERTVAFLEKSGDAIKFPLAAKKIEKAFVKADDKIRQNPKSPDKQLVFLTVADYGAKYSEQMSSGIANIDCIITMKSCEKSPTKMITFFEDARITEIQKYSLLNYVDENDENDENNLDDFLDERIIEDF